MLSFSPHLQISQYQPPCCEGVDAAVTTCVLPSFDDRSTFFSRVCFGFAGHAGGPQDKKSGGHRRERLTSYLLLKIRQTHQCVDLSCEQKVRKHIKNGLVLVQPSPSFVLDVAGPSYHDCMLGACFMWRIDGQTSWICCGRPNNSCMQQCFFVPRKNGDSVMHFRVYSLLFTPEGGKCNYSSVTAAVFSRVRAKTEGRQKLLQYAIRQLTATAQPPW